MSYRFKAGVCSICLLPSSPCQVHTVLKWSPLTDRYSADKDLWLKDSLFRVCQTPAPCRCGGGNRGSVKFCRVTKNKSDASLCSPVHLLAQDCCPGPLMALWRWHMHNTHAHTTFLRTSLNQMQNELPKFLLHIPRCGTSKVERSCRMSRLIREPFCPVMSRQTDVSLPPPLLTRLQRFNTYTRTYSRDETYLFVLSVTTWPITHRHLPSNLLRKSLLTAHAHGHVAVSDIWG